MIHMQQVQWPQTNQTANTLYKVHFQVPPIQVENRFNYMKDGKIARNNVHFMKNS